MSDNLQLGMDEFLPLRDVVFNTLRQAILTGELKPYGNSSGKSFRC